MAYFLRKNPDQTTIVPVENSVIGTYQNKPYHDANTRDVRTWWSTKGDSYGTSDHKEATQWSRNVGSVNESPLKQRRREIAPDGYVIVDVVDTFHISRDMQDPFAWGPSERLSVLMDNKTAETNVKLRLELAQKRENANAQLGVSILEAQKTYDMIAGYVVPTVKALMAARKGDYAGAAGYLGIDGKRFLRPGPLSAKWLEMQYGWKPLLQDIHDTAQLLRNQVREPMLISAKKSGTVSHTTSNGEFGHRVETGTYNVGVTCQFIPDALSKLDSYGLLNPAGIAWELQPFSFCVDWFIPVGNILSALTGTAGLHFRSGYTNAKIQDKLTVYTRANPPAVTISRGEYVVERMKFVRNTLNSFPSVSMYANMNPFQSSERTANAIALITNMLSGR